MSAYTDRLGRLLLLFVLLAGWACGSEPTPTQLEVDPVPTAVAVTPSTVSLVAGDSLVLSAAARTSDGSVLGSAAFTWTSSDPAVAEVSAEGVVRALSSGATTVTATTGGVSGTASLTVEMDPVLAWFAPVVGDTLTLVPQAAFGGTDVSGLVGAVVRLNQPQATVDLTLLDAAGRPAGPTIALRADSGGTVGGDNRIAASDVSVLGVDGVRVWAWISDPSSDTPLQLILDARPGGAPLPAPAMGAGPARSGPQDRLDFITYWDALEAQGDLTVLDRWSRVVQRVIDVNLAQQTDKTAFIDAVTDDLVDLFILDDFYRSWLIDGQSTLGNRFIPEPQDLTGFTEKLFKGEGRFRHFAANASVNEKAWIPEFVVNYAARKHGGDWPWTSDPNGDIAADLETNDIGRRFPAELERLWDRMVAATPAERIDDGESVRRWLLWEFGPAPASIAVVPDPPAVVTAGMSTQLGTTIQDADGNVLTGHDVTWTSSGPTVLTVDGGGLVTGTGHGTATVTALVAGGVQASTVVSVTGLEITGPARIDFTHTMGVTPCPQVVATYTIRNVTDGPLQYSAVERNYGGPLRIDSDPGFGTLQPSESVEETVTYICPNDRSFTSAYEITGLNGLQGEAITTSIPVTGTIDATPGSLTVATVTGGANAPESFIVRDVETGEDLGTIGPNESRTFTDVRPGRYPILLVRPDGANCQEVDGSFLKDVAVPAGGRGRLEFQISCNGSTQQRRIGLDYGAVQRNGSVVINGTQTIPLLEDGNAVGSVPMTFTGEVYVDPARGVFGLGQNGSIEVDLEGATLPAGAPSPDQIEIEIEGRDNVALSDLQVQRKHPDGTVESETTSQIQNGLVLIPGFAVVVFKLTSAWFFDFAITLTFAG
ncbi:MAG: Ig-like domain-containing protein [Gemmatimonadetes bacterium]|nr:Ig-like domain-containing protein [Gemmatimonadota bacterium]